MIVEDVVTGFSFFSFIFDAPTAIAPLQFHFVG